MPTSPSVLMTWSSRRLSILLFVVNLATALNLAPDNAVVEPQDNSIKLGPMRTVSLQTPDNPASTCDWNTRLTQFLLDETKDRIELKYNMEMKINELYRQIEEIKDLFVKQQEERLASKPNNGVAFSAEVEDHLTGLSRDQTILFAKARTNVGNGYSTASGVFTCPVKGTYFFSASILSNLNDRIETEIMLQSGNGDITSVCKLYSGAGNPDRYGSGSGTVVLQLAEGDKVWVRVYNGLGSFIFKSWSSFSGALIH